VRECLKAVWDTISRLNPAIAIFVVKYVKNADHFGNIFAGYGEVHVPEVFCNFVYARLNV